MDLVHQQSHSLLSLPVVQEGRGMMDMLDPQLMQPQNGIVGIDGLPQHQSSFSSAPGLDPSWGYDLNLLSHAASHVASNLQHSYGLEIPQVSQEQVQEPIQQLLPVTMESHYPSRALNDHGHHTPLFESPDIGDPMQDFTIFLDSIGLSSEWDPRMINTTDNEPFTSPELKNDPNFFKPHTNGEQEHKLGPLEETSTFSRFGSRLPSLQPESRDHHSVPPEPPRTNDDYLGIPKSRGSCEVSDSDRQQFASKLASFDSVMPKGFIAPSRHSLSRYLAGYINGFHEHLPFIHVPTLSVANSAPELVLALAAVGAQYRFENSRGIELFYAAKAVVLEQVRRRDGFQIPQLWNRPRTRTGSIVQSPTTGFNNGISSGNSPFPFAPAVEDPIAPDSKEQMDSIQALLLLTAFATWERHPELLREALAFQSILARLVRESGLTSPEIPQPEDISWEEWIRLEGDKRTKLIVYCFFNLHSITWNVPPLILNSELKLDLPDPGNEWKAPNAEIWKKLRSQNTPSTVSFQIAFSRLFNRSAQDTPAPVSPLGNYVLIHGIIQQIFFARQLSLVWPAADEASLRYEDVTILERGLKSWKAGWKRDPQSSLDPQNPNGPIAFTSTALLGLAYIRLHIDMGPLRHLETRDSNQIAQALHNTAPIRRDPRLTPALLHCAHALSIPVRLGIDFVAKTQTFFWSIQHSLCSLECAFLLSKWLHSLSRIIPDQLPPLSEHERKLLVWVRNILEETDMVVPLDGDAGDTRVVNQSQELLEDERKIRGLAVSVVRVWSKTFKGNTSWAIVDMIGNALEVYADLLEEDMRIELGIDSRGSTSRPTTAAGAGIGASITIPATANPSTSASTSPVTRQVQTPVQISVQSVSAPGSTGSGG